MGSKVSENTVVPMSWEEMSIYRNVRVMGSSVSEHRQFSIEPDMQRSAKTLLRGLLQSPSKYMWKC
jgi:hypothetical protein